MPQSPTTLPAWDTVVAREGLGSGVVEGGSRPPVGTMKVAFPGYPFLQPVFLIS